MARWPKKAEQIAKEALEKQQLEISEAKRIARDYRLKLEAKVALIDRVKTRHAVRMKQMSYSMFMLRKQIYAMREASKALTVERSKRNVELKKKYYEKGRIEALQGINSQKVDLSNMANVIMVLSTASAASGLTPKELSILMLVSTIGECSAKTVKSIYPIVSKSDVYRIFVKLKTLQYIGNVNKQEYFITPMGEDLLSRASLYIKKNTKWVE
jgi:hypothetical protein